jgi:hypothetical protein
MIDQRNPQHRVQAASSIASRIGAGAFRLGSLLATPLVFGSCGPFTKLNQNRLSKPPNTTMKFLGVDGRRLFLGASPFDRLTRFMSARRKNGL